MGTQLIIRTNSPYSVHSLPCISKGYFQTCFQASLQPCRHFIFLSLLLLRSERGIQSPSILPSQPLPPLFMQRVVFGPGFAGSAALPVQEMKTTSVSMAALSFSSSSGTIPQCLASNQPPRVLKCLLLFMPACSSACCQHASQDLGCYFIWEFPLSQQG